MQERGRGKEMGTEEVALFRSIERGWKGGNEIKTRVRDEDRETECMRDGERERKRNTQSERWEERAGLARLTHPVTRQEGLTMGERSTAAGRLLVPASLIFQQRGSH